MYMNVRKFFLSVLFIIFMVPSCDSQKLKDGLYARIKTNKGDMIVSLYYKKTPMTVANFVGLAEGQIKNEAKGEGEPYYDGITFHRVIADFMVQTGDPAGTGGGGPGYSFPDEIVSSLKHEGKGVLSMANSGPGTNGSQFFITHKETPWLDGKHTVFGAIDSLDQSSLNVLDSIVKGDKMEQVTILRVGDEAEGFDAKSVFETSKKQAKEAKIRRDESFMEKEKEALAVYTEKEGYTVTQSGLRYKITKRTKGSKPKKGQTVSVHYTGKLTTGKVFDSSKGRKPLEIAIGQGQVIKGWDEGIMLLRKGEKAELVIPSNLGYSDRGAGGVIPPYAVLIFEVSLEGIK